MNTVEAAPELGELPEKGYDERRNCSGPAGYGLAPMVGIHG